MSESQATGTGIGQPRVAGSFQLPTLGPSAPLPTVSNPVLGYVYRDNETYPENLDRIEFIQRHYSLSLIGYHAVYGNGSALIANSAVSDINANFWPNVYVFLHEMAQKRDGYRATDATLNTAANVLYRDSLLIAMKINIRVLAQLYSGALINEATKSTISAFRSERSRIIRDLEASNRLIYPAAWDKFIDYWSHVYSMRPGGPLVVNLFSMDVWLSAGGIFQPTNPSTVWVALPDLTSQTDVRALLTDIEVAIGVLERYDIGVANTLSDMRNINSIYAMMGFPTPQTSLPTISVDKDKFHGQFQRFGVLFNDTKGAGADTHLFWPDIRGSYESLVPVDFGPFSPDELDFIGAKGIYAFDADDDDTPGYTAEANDLTAYGVVAGTDWLTATAYPDIPATKIYTREDGWITLPRELDYTAAAGTQAHIWQIPDITIHPDAWRMIMSEEAEEAYLQNFDRDSHPVQIPFDHFGQSYRKFLYDAYKIPYIT